jgi:hypothetical protein
MPPPPPYQYVFSVTERIEWDWKNPTIVGFLNDAGSGVIGGVAKSAFFALLQINENAAMEARIGSAIGRAVEELKQYISGQFVEERLLTTRILMAKVARNLLSYQTNKESIYLDEALPDTNYLFARLEVLSDQVVGLMPYVTKLALDVLEADLRRQPKKEWPDHAENYFKQMRGANLQFRKLFKKVPEHILANRRASIPNSIALYAPNAVSLSRGDRTAWFERAMTDGPQGPIARPDIQREFYARIVINDNMIQYISVDGTISYTPGQNKYDVVAEDAARWGEWLANEPAFLHALRARRDILDDITWAETEMRHLYFSAWDTFERNTIKRLSKDGVPIPNWVKTPIGGLPQEVEWATPVLEYDVHRPVRRQTMYVIPPAPWAEYLELLNKA